jgi:polyisoprenoid-binding protein YceI
MQSNSITDEIPQLQSFVTRYEIDPTHTSARFKVRHLMISNVRGELGAVTGEILLDPMNIVDSRVSATIDATAINTSHPDRDAHLRSADFLDVANHPTITFRSTRIEHASGGYLRVLGDLTIRGVTHQTSLVVELSDEIVDPWNSVKRGAQAIAKINRKDFGVSWNLVMDAGGVVVGDTVDITIDLELVRV